MHCGASANRITQTESAHPHGIPYHVAAIVYKHRLLCWSANDATRHAEANLLRKLDQHAVNRRRCTLIVLRIRSTSGGRLFLSGSKPCIRCADLISKSGIQHVAWTNDAGTFDGCRRCELQTDHVSRRFR